MNSLGLLVTEAVAYSLSSSMPLDASAPSDFSSTINQIAQEITDASQVLLQAIDNTVIDLIRLAFVTLLILGVFLYFTHLHKRLGRDLIFGGVALALISQFLIPALVKI